MRKIHAPLIIHKAKAVASMIAESTTFWDSFIVFLGSLFIVLAFPFYPYIIALALALFAAVIARKWPPLGMLLGMMFAYPAIVYQSPLLGWAMLPVVSVVLFTMFKHWNIISFLEILIFAPFAPYPFSLLSGFVFFLMVLFALYLGSKHSLMISVPSVFLILLLSSLWMVENSAFMPLNISMYAPKETAIMNTARAAPQAKDLLDHVLGIVPRLTHPQTFSKLGHILGKIFENIFTMLVYDSGLIQLVVWAVVLYVIAVVPALLRRHRYKQTIAAVALLALPIAYMWICGMYGYVFDQSMWLYVAASVLLVFVMEKQNIIVTRERLLFLRERAKKFGKFGLVDLEEAVGVSSMSDVGDYEEVKEELKRAIMLPLEHLGVAHAYGIKPPNGLLLFGPPGTGKTMLMTALAKELNYGFYYVKSSEIMSRWFGETERNITELFEIARKNAPCILFFDEIDALGKRRELYRTDDIGQRVLSLFLQELDGFKGAKRAIVIGATNVPHLLDPALLRPGRFDTIIYMPLPDKKARKDIFKVHTRKLPLADDVNLDKLAAKTRRYSGADIAHVCREAKRLAAERALRKGKIVPVSMQDFVGVIKRMKPSVSLSQLENYKRFRLDYERSYRKETVEEAEEKIRFDDVADLDEIKKLLRENIELPLLRPELLKEYRLRAIRGMLLFGPPGCGKTMVVKAAVNELDIPVLSLSGAELLRKGYEYSIQVIKETFNRAKENAPCIVFIDEIDTLSEQSIFGRSVMGQLLVEMDGIRKAKNIITVATTNKPWLLDPALLRPGRFDKLLYVPLPNADVRRGILEKNLKGINGYDDVDMDVVVRLTEGYSGADMVAVCDEAKRMLVRIKLGEEKAETIKELGEEGLAEHKPVLTTELLKAAVSKVAPSVPGELLMRYQKFKQRTK